MRIAIIGLIVMSFISCKAQEKYSDQVVHLDVVSFSKMLNEKDIQLIDVRTPTEYANGHVKDAKLIDYKAGDFKSKAFEGLDGEKPVLLYCASGRRSARAAKMYVDAGFKKVYNLVGGFRAWKAENLKTIE